MNDRNDVTQYQLPASVVPSHYEIRIAPDFGSFRFRGQVTVDVRVQEPVSQVVAHSLGLKITEARAVDSKGRRLEAKKTQARVSFFDAVTGEAASEAFESAAAIDDTAQTATFSFGERLAKGDWKLSVEFEGSLVQPSLEGFYRSKWTDDNKLDHWMASTQFEATHARRAFPCWDEPAIKATYAVTLVIDKGLTALSNMRAIKETVDGDYRTIAFAPTPRMSTYLLAWCVGELESSEPAWANGKELRIWSVPGKNRLKSYALTCAAYGVQWYERTLGVPYFGGDKIDMIAIPEFRSGAMENTGLITYRATALLVDEPNATVGELQRVAEVVFHELAHMWFGNLVTMAWWDGLPLNESNATIFAYLVMADFQPEWHIFNTFGLHRAAAFALDSLNSTHPCWAPVGHPDEVEQRFDKITYEKGGSVEFQLHQFVGGDAFYAGAHLYLMSHSHGNAEVTQLWDDLEEGVRRAGLQVPVRQIMDSWFLADGHPVVTVSPSSRPGSIKLTQERFAFLPKGDHANQLWPIPLHLRSAAEDGSMHEEKQVFSQRELEVPLQNGFRYVVLNAGGSGFYRVRYAPKLLASLLAAPFERLEVIERFNLVNDAWAFVRAQKLAADAYLDLVEKLAGENDPSVWSIIGGSLHALHGLTSGATRAAFKKLIRDLVRPVFRDLGWAPQPEESTATRELRGSLAALLGTIAEDEEVQSAADGLFASWKKDRGSVDPNVVPALVSTLAYAGGTARFDEYLALSRSAPTDQEKLRFLRALGEFRVPELLEAAIVMTMNEVKTDDAPYILGAWLTAEHAGPAAWRSIRDNWGKIVKKFPASGTVRMIEGCSALDTPELSKDVEQFFSRTKVPQGDMAVAQMLERLSVNVRLRQAESARLAAYVDKRPRG
ncbi:MAG TPA: M1 family metallopeptidase [Spirochaetia bacterium]|nr:M1 family metallopeptidase [Spirochaetia bacterium]